MTRLTDRLRQPRSSRAVIAGVFTAVVLSGLALLGGLGHASVGNTASAAQYEYNPTTISQCQQGGWRNFPQFKNQGDCVSFVATGGKNPAG